MNDIITQARTMRAKFLGENYGGRVPVAISTDKFARFIGKETGYTIESVIVPDMVDLRGMLLRYSAKKAVILISDHNNECWRRFTYIKELSHLFLEKNPDDFNADALEQAKALVDIVQGLNDPPEEQKKLYISEITGIIAAMEIMIPEELLGYIAHLSNVDKMRPYAIAAKFKVPQKFIEHQMDKNNIPLNTAPE